MICNFNYLCQQQSNNHRKPGHRNMLKYSQIAFYCETPKSTHLVLHLKNKIQTYAVASFSVILSSAAYILYHFPQLPHPTSPQTKPSHQRFDEDFPSPFMSLHPFFDQWVQVLTQCFFQGNAVRIQDTLYLKVNVSYKFAQAILKNQASFEQYHENPSIQKVFSLGNIQVPVKRIGWINCSTSQKNARKADPTVNTPAILLGQIFNNEHYKIWNILVEQVPTVQQLLQYDTIIIPGSGLSVLDKVKPVDLVAKNIITAYKKSDKLKILGICYGHQLMAREFGAKIVKRDRYGGLENIIFDTQVLNQFAYLEPLRNYNPPTIPLSEHHEDFVTTTPAQYIKLGESNSCENEALVSKDGRILSTQFHPQYNYFWGKAYTTRVNIYYKQKMLQKPKYSHNQEYLKKHLQACQNFRLCISKFI